MEGGGHEDIMRTKCLLQAQYTFDLHDRIHPEQCVRRCRHPYPTSSSKRAAVDSGFSNNLRVVSSLVRIPN